jgi:hypothetical protein
MIHGVHLKPNTGLPWKKWLSARRLFTSTLDRKLKFEKETGEGLHLERRFVWC